MSPSWKLPAPRNLGWNLKPIDSAGTSIEHLADGRMELRIEHDLVRGITVEMLAWWFQSFDQPCTHRGKRYEQMYLLWHPEDHHSVQLGRDETGRVSVGQTIKIREAFGRNMRSAVDAVATIHHYDDSGVGFHVKKLRRIGMRLDHRFRDVTGGVQYRSRMQLGHEEGFLHGLGNRLALPFLFGNAKARAWQRHNVEEVGSFENFLPELFEDYRRSGT